MLQISEDTYILSAWIQVYHIGRTELYFECDDSQANKNTYLLNKNVYFPDAWKKLKKIRLQ
jgi:hypothetical protein